VQLALQAFYGALNYEQKACLYRDMAALAVANAPQTAGQREAQNDRREPREYWSRRQRWRLRRRARLERNL
jgi:hypothetical protein